MFKVTNPTTGQVHAVRNFRTNMILGLECGKPASRAKSEPTDGEVTCPKCAERVALVAA